MWCTWIQENLNASDRRYSIELVYGWAPERVIVVFVIPVMLSFVSGLWYMLATGDVSTAWTIASYVVTAGGSKSDLSITIERSVTNSSNSRRGTVRHYDYYWWSMNSMLLVVLASWSTAAMICFLDF